MILFIFQIKSNECCHVLHQESCVRNHQFYLFTQYTFFILRLFVFEFYVFLYIFSIKLRFLLERWYIRLFFHMFTMFFWLFICK